MHPAHLPLPPGHAPGLLEPGSRFRVGEKLGRERRVYDFRVAVYDPATPALVLEAEVLTAFGHGDWGPEGPQLPDPSGWPRIRSRLRIDFRIRARGEGCHVEVLQSISFGRAWLDRLLSPPWLWKAVAAHAEAESREAARLLLESDSKLFL